MNFNREIIYKIRGTGAAEISAPGNLTIQTIERKRRRVRETRGLINYEILFGFTLKNGIIITKAFDRSPMTFRVHLNLINYYINRYERP